jgi:glycerol-3-phosphate dehydrogenase subunit C
MEALLGIHRDKLLPDFASQTFSSWAKRMGKIKEDHKAEAVLFQTCYVENNEPQIGVDTIEVMEKK